MMTDYDYLITDTLYDKLDPDKLKNEVHENPDITIGVDRVTYQVTAGTFKVWMKADLDATQKTELDSTVAAHDGEPEPDEGMPVSVTNEALPTEVTNHPIVINDLREDSRVDLFSINLCDKCTWYSGSQEQNDEVLTTSDNLTFSSTHMHWIDLYHARLSDEDDLVGDYPIAVTVNDSPVTMDTPFGPGGDEDYSISPESGEITFHTALDPSDVVKASFHYADTSEWVVEPAAGKTLELLKAECQLSKSIDIKDTIQYEVLILGQYVGGPPGVLVPIRTKKYKCVKDFINESNGAYPEVPAFGGSSRGISDPVLIFPWLYLAKTQLLSAYGMAVKVRLAADQVCDGELAVVTFYCVSTDAS